MNSASVEKVRNADVLFSICTRQSTSTTSGNYSTTTNMEVEGDAEEPQADAGPDAIMCVLWKTNRIGTAFYRKNDHQVKEISAYVESFDLPGLRHKVIN